MYVVSNKLFVLRECVVIEVCAIEWTRTLVLNYFDSSNTIVNKVDGMVCVS